MTRVEIRVVSPAGGKSKGSSNGKNDLVPGRTGDHCLAQCLAGRSSTSKMALLALINREVNWNAPPFSYRGYLARLGVLLPESPILPTHRSSLERVMLPFMTGDSQPTRILSPDLRRTSGIGPGAVLRQRYRLDSEIGRGGMGVVYRATDLELIVS